MIATRERVDISLGLYVYDNAFAGLSIATMQFTIALLTEIINLILITGQKSVIDCIMNFVALKVISEIDDIYLGAMRDPILESIASDNGGDWTPKVIYGWVPFEERTIVNKLLFVLLKINKLIYNGFYFYFFPFTVLVLNYASQRCDQTQVLQLDGVTVTADGSAELAPLCEDLEVFYFSKAFSDSLI